MVDALLKNETLNRAEFLAVMETGAVQEGLGDDISVPLRAICFLSQAKENRIEAISGAEAYGLLMMQIYRPRDPLLTQKTLALADRLLERVRLYRLGCNMEPEAAVLSYGVMSGAEACDG